MMMGFGSRQLSTLMSLLIVTIGLGVVSSFSVVLNLNIEDTEITIEMRDKEANSFTNNFLNCICSYPSYSNCNPYSRKLGTYTGPSAPVMTSEAAADYNELKHFTCTYNSWNAGITCVNHENMQLVCGTDSCTVKIIVSCPNNAYVALAWNSMQRPTILNFSEVTVIDCCQTTPATTKTTTTPTATTIVSTLPISSIDTTHSTPNNVVSAKGITGTSSAELAAFTSPRPGSAANNYTYSQSEQKEGTDDGLHISNQHIGIIVGAALGAILLTVLTMLLIWKLKSCREIKKRNERTERAEPESVNLEAAYVSHVESSNSARGTMQTTPYEPSLIQRRGMSNHQTTDSYVYIDLASRDYENPNTAFNSQGSPPPGVEKSTEKEKGEYSYLRNGNSNPQNPNNLLDKDALTNQPIIVPSLQAANQALRLNLGKDYPDINLTNHDIPFSREQAIPDSGSSNLYAKLGESKVVLENTYNSLNNVNDRPGTDSGLSQSSKTTNHEPEFITKAPPSSTQTLPVFSNKSYPSMFQIVDDIPSNYTQIIAKSKRESSNSQESQNSETVSSANRDSEISTYMNSIGGSAEKNKPKLTEDGANENIDVETRQPYSNFTYETHDVSRKPNTRGSTDSLTYVNQV